jgi:SOS response regulatory protein OraA/RecX
VVEVTTRLAEIGFSRRAVTDAVTRLVELRFVDDEGLARSRAETLAARGYGDLWIERDLGRRGLGDGVIARALASLSREPERARAWLVQGGRRGPKRAAWGALVRRGFAAETAEDILGSVDGEGPNDDADGVV